MSVRHPYTAPVKVVTVFLSGTDSNWLRDRFLKDMAERVPEDDLMWDLPVEEEDTTP